MSELSTVQGSVTLRKMRTGATVQMSLSSSMQLFQLYTDDGGNVGFTPDWSGDNTHPIVKVNLTSSSKETYSISSVLWYINGVSTTVIQDCRTGTDSDGKPYLEINTNLADQGILNFNSGTLTAIVAFSDTSGNNYQMTKSEIIRVQKAVPNGYYVFIDATGTTVDENTSVTLTATLRMGTVDVSGNDDVAFKWFTSTTQQTAPYQGRTLTVNASMVGGSQLFICRAYTGGTEVDAESIMIADTSDPMRIVASVTQYSGGSQSGYEQQNVTATDIADTNDKAVVTFKIVQSDGSAFSGTADWKAQKMHAGTAKLIAKPPTGQDYTTDTTAEDASYNTQSANNAATVSISVFDADFYTTESSGSGAVVKDEVVVTATASNITSPAS